MPPCDVIKWWRHSPTPLISEKSFASKSINFGINRKIRISRFKITIEPWSGNVPYENYRRSKTGTSTASFLRFDVSFPYCIHIAAKVWSNWETFEAFGRVSEWQGKLWSVCESFGAFGRVLERLRGFWERLEVFWSVWESFRSVWASFGA